MPASIHKIRRAAGKEFLAHRLSMPGSAIRESLVETGSTVKPRCFAVQPLACLSRLANSPCTGKSRPMKSIPWIRWRSWAAAALSGRPGGNRIRQGRDVRSASQGKRVTRSCLSIESEPVDRRKQFHLAASSVASGKRPTLRRLVSSLQPTVSARCCSASTAFWISSSACLRISAIENLPPSSSSRRSSMPSRHARQRSRSQALSAAAS